MAALIYLQDGGPPLFHHPRLGKDLRAFNCLKFRSMRIYAAELLSQHLEGDPLAREEWAASQKLRQDPRITALGTFMRQTSLDELPQLFNVLTGEMSLVGSRPIVGDEIERYGRSIGHYRRHPAGITGLWQVSGRNDVGYGRRVALDRLFALKRSFGLYVGILGLTVPVVLFQRGSY